MELNSWHAAQALGRDRDPSKAVQHESGEVSYRCVGCSQVAARHEANYEAEAIQAEAEADCQAEPDHDATNLAEAPKTDHSAAQFHAELHHAGWSFLASWRLARLR